ncbi:MAG: 50S ribosomal protein L16 [Thermoplasmata archaeon]|nr:50S ribosomal protein L16 [Thermoplasmata archaeon]
MPRKPARMYTPIRGQSYTRKKYIGGIPALRIVQFDVGSRDKDFPVSVTLIAKEACQIRHLALEAARVTANRYIQKHAGREYHLKIRIYPHNVLRENKIAQGAGADRISEGMRHAFGKAIGTAARVKRGQALITLKVEHSNIPAAKEALRKAGAKLPTPIRIRITEDEKKWI